MSGDLDEEAPQVTKFNRYSPYYHEIFKQNPDLFKGTKEIDISDKKRPAYFSKDGTMLSNKFDGIEINSIEPGASINPDTIITPHTDIDTYTMVITYKQDTKEKEYFIYNSQERESKKRDREIWSDPPKKARADEAHEDTVQASESDPPKKARADEAHEDTVQASESDLPKKARADEAHEDKVQASEAEASEAEASLNPTIPHGSSLTVTGGKKYIARGGVGGGLVRRISASIHDARARQTREGHLKYELHRSFFLIIWEHFAHNDDIRKRPREYKPHPFTIKFPIYTKDGTFACFVLLRCVTRYDNPVAGITNIAYSVLFEFTQYIHWSIFYSFSVNHGRYIVNSGQVSELHFTLNQYNPPRGVVIPKTRMFFEYTRYINEQIQRAIGETDTTALSSDQQQVGIMGIVSELMLLTLYQLATAKSYTTDQVFDNAALTMRQHIDIVGENDPANTLLTIARRHADLIIRMQEEFTSRDSDLSFTSKFFIDHLIGDIMTIPGGGGKNINRYLTKINNIKERLKLLKKNKVKNKVKIIKLSKSIDELKAKLKKQKEKEKAKLKKQKEKEKAKLKKQKEKEKAKLKKQKEKEKAKRKKTKAKKS